MPRGVTTDGIPLAQRVADAALQLLRNAEDALPCSRVAISTTDFEDVSKNTTSIMHFFTHKGASGAGKDGAQGDGGGAAVVQVGGDTHHGRDTAPTAARGGALDKWLHGPTRRPPIPSEGSVELSEVDVQEQQRILEDIARQRGTKPPAKRPKKTGQPTIAEAFAQGGLQQHRAN